jgi:ATP-binding cassette, subfamily B, bacterial PglK
LGQYFVAQTTAEHRTSGNMYVRLFRHLSPQRRWRLAALIPLSLVAAICEVLSIAAIIPFITFISDIDAALQSKWLNMFISPQMLAGLTEQEIIVGATFALCGIVIFSAAWRIFLVWLSGRVAFSTGRDLQTLTFANALRRPYAHYALANSSNALADVGKASEMVTRILQPALQITVNGLIAGAILLGFLWLDPLIFVSVLVVIGALYGLINKVSRRYLVRAGEVFAYVSGPRFRVMQEGFGAIRDVIIDRNSAAYVQQFHRLVHAQSRAAALAIFLGTAPRYIVEAVGIVVLLVFAVLFTGRGDNISAVLPTLAALALGAQRLLPLAQQIYLAWSQIVAGRQVLQDVLTILDQPTDPTAELPRPTQPILLSSAIELRDVDFRYTQEAPLVVNQLSLTIPKGAQVGFVGKTGSGKSTTVDIIMGLLEPCGGQVLIDGEPLNSKTISNWHAQLAHVPQAIFLSDSTLAENIAFGVRTAEIDLARVRKAAQIAQIDDFISSLSEGYNTQVGERGVRLSGGQRQRIGIARAVYKRASVLVLDEATSALDSETEALVIEAIRQQGEGQTILMIAHRLSTLERCDMIFRLEAGRLAEITYPTRAREVVAP